MLIYTSVFKFLWFLLFKHLKESWVISNYRNINTSGRQKLTGMPDFLRWPRHAGLELPGTLSILCDLFPSPEADWSKGGHQPKLDKLGSLFLEPQTLNYEPQQVDIISAPSHWQQCLREETTMPYVESARPSLVVALRAVWRFYHPFNAIDAPGSCQ